METIPSFYNNKWTVLQKLKYIELFMKNNNIDWNTVVWTMNADGTYTIKGKNFIGEEITIADKLSFPEIEGLSALSYDDTIMSNELPVVGNNILVYKLSFSRVPEIEDTFIAIIDYNETAYICNLEVSEILSNNNVKCIINTVTSLNITINDILKLIEGSDYISFDLNSENSKLIIALDKTKVDDSVKEDSDNLIISGAVFDALSNKQDKLTSGAITSDMLASHSVTDDKLSIVILDNINKSLKISNTSPIEFELVGISTNNSQKNVEVGDGLKIENDHIKVNIAGSGMVGGVNPSAKSSSDTLEVKIDNNGKLWTKPFVLPFDTWDGFGNSGSIVLPSGGWYYICNVPGTGILFQVETSYSTPAQIFEIQTSNDTIITIETIYSSNQIILIAKSKVGAGEWTDVTKNFYYKKI